MESIRVGGVSDHKARLQKARELLELGWCQGIAHIPTEPPKYCLMGSIDAACGVYDESFENDLIAATALSTAVCDYVRNVLDASGYHYIMAFNDKPGRTLNEVLEILDKAIASVPNEESV